MSVRETATFDAYADDYETMLHQGLRFTGERSLYFAQGRLRALASRLEALGERPRVILDFGCGTGGTTALLKEVLGGERVIGVDVSSGSLSVAEARSRGDDIEFRATAAPISWKADCAYCNGVFHHLSRRSGRSPSIMAARTAAGWPVRRV